jgi:hypothetical protein
MPLLSGFMALAWARFTCWGLLSPHSGSNFPILMWQYPALPPLAWQKRASGFLKLLSRHFHLIFLGRSAVPSMPFGLPLS